MKATCPVCSKRVSIGWRMESHLAKHQRKVAETDKLERAIADALTAAGIEYRTDFEGMVPEHLDFYLPVFDVHLEIKSGHSPRIAAQMARSERC